MSPGMADLPSFLLSSQDIWLILFVTYFVKFANSLEKKNNAGGGAGGWAMLESTGA